MCEPAVLLRVWVDPLSPLQLGTCRALPFCGWMSSRDVSSLGSCPVATTLLSFHAFTECWGQELWTNKGYCVLHRKMCLGDPDENFGSKLPSLIQPTLRKPLWLSTTAIACSATTTSSVLESWIGSLVRYYGTKPYWVSDCFERRGGRNKWKRGKGNDHNWLEWAMEVDKIIHALLDERNRCIDVSGQSTLCFRVGNFQKHSQCVLIGFCPGSNLKYKR